jgi:hypothetical protein
MSLQNHLERTTQGPVAHSTKRPSIMGARNLSNGRKACHLAHVWVFPLLAQALPPPSSATVLSICLLVSSRLQLLKTHTTHQGHLTSIFLNLKKKNQILYTPDLNKRSYYSDCGPKQKRCPCAKHSSPLLSLWP